MPLKTTILIQKKIPVKVNKTTKKHKRPQNGLFLSLNKKTLKKPFKVNLVN